MLRWFLCAAISHRGPHASCTPRLLIGHVRKSVTRVTVWPSGLRRQTQVLVEKSAWVRTPQLSVYLRYPAVGETKTPPTGLEPAIFGLEVQRVIHYATGARIRVGNL